ncbi:MAG: hypothetical protein H6868_00420 [Rhodospirillales bacterium]|nr:hypothetical protein [Rhodospirillales bacterium]
MIRHIQILSLLLGLCLWGQAPGTALAQTGGEPLAPRFFEMLPDVPLMDGLYEIPEGALVFDKPEGRIIESLAVTEAADAEKLASFYDVTLPQLGWVSVGIGQFVRQGEALSYRIVPQDDSLLIYFEVRPRAP